MGELREFTREEVAEHCTEESCWLIAHGKVYDVTSWLPYHPAGIRSILRHAGEESTEDYDFHSRNARKLWEEHCIGIIKGEGPSSCTIS